MWAEGPGVDGLVFEMGGELVEELCGVELRGRQTGTTELGGVLQTFMGLVRVARLLLLLQARRIVIKMDNLEDVLAMRRYKVSGTQRVGKYLLMRLLFKLFDLHGLTVTFEHVHTALNRGDAASRLASFQGAQDGPAGLRVAIFDLRPVYGGLHVVCGVRAEGAVFGCDSPVLLEVSGCWGAWGQRLSSGSTVRARGGRRAGLLLPVRGCGGGLHAAGH